MMMKLILLQLENIMKTKEIKKKKKLTGTKKTKMYSRAGKNQYQALLQNFSPNPGTCLLLLLFQVFSLF